MSDLSQLSDVLFSMGAPFDICDREKIVRNYDYDSMDSMLESYGFIESEAKATDTVICLSATNHTSSEPLSRFAAVFAFNEYGVHLGYAGMHSARVLRQSQIGRTRPSAMAY